MNIHFVVLGISPDYPDDRPLTEQEISIINKSLHKLVRTLEPYSVTDHLFALDCLTKRSITLIKSKQTKEEVTKQLFDILTRRSKRDLKTFYAVLKEHGQYSAASILEPGADLFAVFSVELFLMKMLLLL